jgi:hypothetical protein
MNCLKMYRLCHILHFVLKNNHNGCNHSQMIQKPCWTIEKLIVVTYEIRVFFEGAQKEVFSSIFKKTL